MIKKKILNCIRGGNDLTSSVPSWYAAWDFEIRCAVQDKAKEHKIDHNVLVALVQTESSGNPYAIRGEFKGPLIHQEGEFYQSRWKYPDNPKGWSEVVGSTHATEGIGQATSWGLCQVMGTVAREHGFNRWFPELCQPEIGIEYGCLHLKAKMRRYGSDPSRAYAAYNGGSVRMTPGGMFENQENVDRFMTFYREIRG